MAFVRLAVVLAIIACYIGGMATSLFGPAWGRFLGVIAFVATLVLMGILAYQFRRGTIAPVSATAPIVIWFRPLVLGLMILCVTIFVAAFVTMQVTSQGAGVAHGAYPVFKDRTEYLLNNHGVFTPVAQTRYRVVGTCFIVGWHSFGLLFALFALHLVLYGRWPPGFSDGNGSS